MGKAGVALSKYVTIPRMELLAATLSAKIYLMLRKEFELPIVRNLYYIIFWTDSEAVLGYIRNQLKKVQNVSRK